MRILHILDHSIPLHSGYSFRTLSILKEQRALGWETFHLTGPKQEACTVAEENIEGWHFFRTQQTQGVFSALPVLREFELMGDVAFRIEEVVKRVRPHILHAHSPVLNAVPALRVGRRLRIPVVYELRALWEDAAVSHGTAKEGGVRYRLSRRFESYALKRADAVTTICEGLRQDIMARGIAAERITVIPNAVDIEKFSLGGRVNESLQHKLGLEGTKVLGFIGSFYAYEGLSLLLAAMPQMLAREPSLRLLLVGGGQEEARLASLARSLGVESKVIFAGRVPHQQVDDYYNLIDLLVYPRLPIRLTELVTPLKPLEAMAQGRLLVASDVGGHRELIRDAETGFLFRAGDVNALAAKVMEVLDNTTIWQRTRLRARSFVESERTWKSSVARYADVYERLLDTAQAKLQA
jgi:PEP-CTERM/exosortase A-associated glycosyltransferase